MSKLAKIALAKALLMGLLPEKTKAEITKEEEETNRAIAEGLLNPYEVQKQVDEALKPFIKAEVRKRAIVTYYTDENGQIKRKNKWRKKHESRTSHIFHLPKLR